MPAVDKKCKQTLCRLFLLRYNHVLNDFVTYFNNLSVGLALWAASVEGEPQPRESNSVGKPLHYSKVFDASPTWQRRDLRRGVQESSFGETALNPPSCSRQTCKRDTNLLWFWSVSQPIKSTTFLGTENLRLNWFCAIKLMPEGRLKTGPMQVCRYRSMIWETWLD